MESIVTSSPAVVNLDSKSHNNNNSSSKKEQTINDKKEHPTTTNEIIKKKLSSSSSSLNLEKPMDGLTIKSFLRRERAWRKLALKLYETQPSFMKRGSERFDSLIEYDPIQNIILWDKQPLPGTSCWKRNCALQEKLGQSILVLMVKNESKIIERLLESLIQDIDGFIILDTGSTDNTQQLMWDFLVTKHQKRGAIYTSPFWDFSSCRSITVQLAYKTGDYLLLMDADYKLVKEETETKDAKTGLMHKIGWRTHLPEVKSDNSNAPMWIMLETVGDLAYSRPHVVSGYTRWYYACRTHEHLSKSKHDKNEHPLHQMMFPWLKIDHVGDGGSKADKLPRDIVLLLMDLMDNPKSERAYFYLGNSLKQLGMFEWAIRTYKIGMNLCGWREEMYCAATSVAECLQHLPGGTSHERKLSMVVHGITQNPDRLELLCDYMKRCRDASSSGITELEYRDQWCYILCSLSAFFTHNEYPKDDKLFVKRHDHDFGFWFEVAIAAFWTPTYLELGVYCIQKVLNHPEYSKQPDNFKASAQRNADLYEVKLKAMRNDGILMTKPIRTHLLTTGHKLYQQSKFKQAYEAYEMCLHSVVPKNKIPIHLHPQDEVKSRIDVAGHTESIKSATFHRFHRLTSWKSAQITTHFITEHDHDRALACFQMAKCQEQMTNNDHWNKVRCAFLYVDALKFVPLWPLATTALYQLSIMMPSPFTRLVLYLLRLVSASPASQLSIPVARSLALSVQSVTVDESVFVEVTSLNSNKSRVLGSKSILKAGSDEPAIKRYENFQRLKLLHQQTANNTSLKPQFRPLGFYRPSCFV